MNYGIIYPTSSHYLSSNIDFENYIIKKGFYLPKRGNEFHKKVKGDKIICKFNITIYKISVISDGDDSNYGYEFLDFNDFKSTLTALLREYRLDDILNKSK